MEIWFWQRILSPHMVHLASSLAKLEVVVKYVVEERISDARRSQGWVAPEAEGLDIVVMSDFHHACKLMDLADRASIHICQGLRPSGLIGRAMKALVSNQFQTWVIMETVRDHNPIIGRLKRYYYSQLARRLGPKVTGILAIGANTPKWLESRGLSQEKIFPFAYFLEQPKASQSQNVSASDGAIVRLAFVGRFIPLKRLDWVIDALGELLNYPFELVVVGSGPLENSLRRRSEFALGSRCRWIGRLNSQKVPEVLETIDCLILPSAYDGWGAVASEALMAGAKVVCSDACGCADAVASSGVGGVFASDSRLQLRELLLKVILDGALAGAERDSIRKWSQSLNQYSGADYLYEIFRYSSGHAVDRPVPPWNRIVKNAC